MSTRNSIPAPELAPVRLADRKQHLIAEITRERSRLSLPTFSFPRLRLVALATGVCAAGATALVLMLTGGSGTPQSPFLVQAIHGPSWTAYTGSINWGGGMNFNPAFGCESAVQVIFGCNGILTVPDPASPAQTTPSSAVPSTTVIDGGSPAQQALLRSIIDAMQPNTIDKIQIVASGKNIVLRMTPVSLRMTGVHSMRTYWEESLVAAAFRDRTNTGGHKLAVAVENGADRGVIAPGPASALPTARPGDAKAARQRFKDAAAKIGVSLDELTIYQPDGVAVAATLKSGDPAAFLAHQMPMFLAALGDRWRDYDGTYIRLVDDSRTTVWETSSTGRISSGSVGSRQDLAGCSPVANWGPTPPPCPAK